MKTWLSDKQRKRVLSRLGIPKRYWAAALEDFSCELPSLHDSLYIYGGVGSGKTHMLAALASAKYLATSGGNVSIRFIVFSDMLEGLKAEFTKEQTLLDELSTVDVLYLDDICAVSHTDWRMDTFYTLLNRRYNEMRQTVLTSNHTPKKLTSVLDARIVRRIRDLCTAFELN